MTIAEFAARAEISKSLAYRLIQEGRVPHRRVGARGRRGKILVSDDDLRRFLESTRIDAK